ncbi:MAG: LemA protein [Candidatus Peregrinibacteria bacterium Greene1014_49]|nr:MAG: LemA protein [Candidatus Peregrinibacteria bacterium Greene1014_49]
MNKTLWIILGIVAVLGLWLWSGYNGLITGRESVTASWAQVETQYQRRVDLVPNLVSTVKGAADFEQETFTAITEARSRWQTAPSRNDRIAAAGEMETALSRLMVSVENYPQLQATQAFRDLMTQLEGTENRIGTARRDYNESVRGYNLRVKRFPSNILAGIFSFDAEQFFEAQAGAETAPKVDFE